MSLGISLTAAIIAEANMSYGSATTHSAEAAEEACDLRFDVSCKYVLRDETLRILLAIVQAARESKERHQSEAA